VYREDGTFVKKDLGSSNKIDVYSEAVFVHEVGRRLCV
jgi:hypothetical protein